MRQAIQASALESGQRFSPHAFGGNVYRFLRFDRNTDTINYSLVKEAPKKGRKPQPSEYIGPDTLVYLIQEEGEYVGGYFYRRQKILGHPRGDDPN